MLSSVVELPDKSRSCTFCEKFVLVNLLKEVLLLNTLNDVLCSSLLIAGIIPGKRAGRSNPPAGNAGTGKMGTGNG